MNISYWVNLAHPKAYKQAVDDGQNHHHFAYGEFLCNMGPYILKLVKKIKYAASVAGAAAVVIAAGPGGGVIGAEAAKKLADRDYTEAELLERTTGQRNREAQLPCCRQGSRTSPVARQESSSRG